jgi:hypothetical protein
MRVSIRPAAAQLSLPLARNLFESPEGDVHSRGDFQRRCPSASRKLGIAKPLLPRMKYNQTPVTKTKRRTIMIREC